MKIAYLMLVHSNPQLQKRAVEILVSEDSACFIHLDLKADARQFSGLDRDQVTFVKPQIPVYWGEFSQVRATMQLIRQALSGRMNYDYLVLLQGADYPLRGSRYIENFFTRNRGSEFINIVSMPALGFPLSKITKLRYPSRKPVKRFVARALGKAGFRRDYRKYLGDMRPFAGDASWALSREACQYVIDFADRHPNIDHYFQNTESSDEMFFHTILGNSPFHSRVRRSLHYRDYPPNFSHPAMLSEQHVRFFESRDKVWIEDEWGAGEMLFARKFSDRNLHVLDRIDEMIRRIECEAATPQNVT